MQHISVFLVSFLACGVTGFVPDLLHLIKRRDVAQFGQCSSADVQSIFVNYPDVCYSAFSELRSALQNETTSVSTFQAYYTQLCSQECTEQIKTFSSDCQVPTLTDPILHACEQDKFSGDFCFIGLYKNNGTKAAADCYFAVATGHCSEECSSSLTQLRNDLSCCINALFNVSTYGFDKLRVASHELWTLCGIEEVEQCGNSPLAVLSGAPKHIPTFFVTLMISMYVWLTL